MENDTMKKCKKKNEMVMPTKNNYSMLLSFNYTIKQLKEIAVYHKIKLTCGLIKSEIVSKIYNYFKHYDNVVIIQRAWRCYLWRQYNNLRGPARFNRRLCVNETDFFTMDNVSHIPYKQFFSFKDHDDVIYGFDMISIYNLFHKCFDSQPSNPYNRNVLSKNIKKNVLKIIWFSRLLKDEINVNINNETEKVEQTIASRSINLFHDMDILGNYTNVDWFMSLPHIAIVRYIAELIDIWSYRANLNDRVKQEICPRHRDLFRTVYITDIRFVSLPIIQDIALNIMEMLVYTGINRDSRALGASFVLTALTLVSADAANDLPWLFQSVF